MIINHNLSAMNAQRQMGVNQTNATKSMEKLSSGLRINRAGDDAAGLAISEKMRSQIRGLDQATRNAQDGISMIQTAEGALNETQSILQRMRELSNQSANGTNTETDRSSIQDEINQLTSEINRIGNTTEFNTQKLLNGGMSSADGAKVTQATSATVTATDAVTKASSAAGLTITVDDRTFDISGISVPTADAAGAKAAATALGEKSSGGVKLSELVDITAGTDGKLTFTAKSTGSNSSISFSADDAALGVKTATDKATGTPTTMERAGLEGTAVTAAISVAANDGFKITVGGGSEVEVKFDNAKAYTNDDAGRQDFVKDLNAALQKAGLDGQVSASLSQDDKIQLISETGKDLEIVNGSLTGLTNAGIADTLKPQNVQQVVGPGAQGSGFSTTFQIGANKGQSMDLVINDMRAAALGITGNSGQVGFTSDNSVTNGTTSIKAEAALNVMTKESASNAIEVLDKAIDKVSAERGKLGSVQNRLEHTINNLGTSSENLTAAESRVRDVDMAKEMMEMSKNNILQQASQAMLAQANQQPQQVLQLLR